MKRIITFFLAGCMMHGVYAQQLQPKVWKEATGTTGYKYKYVEGDPTKARFYTLPNGLTVVMAVNKKTPRIQTLIGTRAGSNQDPATHTGLAHYLEHLLFKGTQHYGSLDWSKEKPLLDQIDGLYEAYGKIPQSDSAARKAKYHEIDSVSGLAAKFAIANEYDKMMTAMGAQGTNAHTSVEETVYEEDIPATAVDKYLAVQAERFKDPVFRIFHTELEAVYEEKNRGLDNDGRKMYETLLAALFPTHNYGQQTTIGTVEHLKNPSLLEIKKFYNTYYVPNNMAIVMVGDLNPDETIRKIASNFSWWQAKPVPAYKPAPEKALTAAVEKEVLGPNPDMLFMAWRLPGVEDHRDYYLASLVGSILTNGKAGIVDINVNKQQKALQAGAQVMQYKDYSGLAMFGMPRAGQSLEELKALLLTQIDSLKAGKFDEKLISAIVSNEKKSLLEGLKDNNAIASYIMDEFIKSSGKYWNYDIAEQDIKSKFTKADVIAFANKYLGNNNYVVVYKRKGEDTTIQKVPKPSITEVAVNRDAQSAFLKQVEAMPSNKVTPVFLDFSKDIQTAKSGPATVYYSQNKDNSLFRLYYRLNMGTWNNKYLGLAAQYLQYLGTPGNTSTDISKQFYNLAGSFGVNPGTEFTTIYVTGLQENFTKTVTLFENLLQNCIADTAALKKMIARVNKQRKDAKSNKAQILSGLNSYALYGAKNPFNYTLSDEELKAIKAEDLVKILHDLTKYNHDVIYFGPQPLATLTPQLTALHKIPASFLPNPGKVNYAVQTQSANQVLFAHYDMVQAEINWARNIEPYNTADYPTIQLYNSYFGGSMAGIVFQTIRESKALAYSTYALIPTPNSKENPYTYRAYVGTQADKLDDAIRSMNELINTTPDAEKTLAAAKVSIKKDIETDRVMDENVIFTYLAAKRLGLDYDIRKNVYNQIDNIGYAEVKKYADQYIASKPYTYCIVASDKRVKTDDLKKYGEVKVLTLQEIFGY